jgi:serine phosphatase RsbU (regulator of sigma subunit)
MVLLNYFHSRKTKKQLEIHANEKSSLQNKVVELSTTLASHASEKQQLETEKQKLEDKNKKFFALSETVYKEKKRVDEEIEKLQLEKEKLAAEKAKVDEKVKKLWSQSTAIHKEKERINILKLEIEQKHTEIMDSVNYAQRIQEAILPDKKEIVWHLPDSFILFQPRNIVSGDFYWFTHKNGKSIIAAVDCTGHGVPGAFMSMIGNTLLNQIVNEKGIVEPAQILNLLNEEVNRSLKQTQQDSKSRDGMDIAICSFTQESSHSFKLEYAGANRPIYLIQNGALTETKANKFPIGGLSYEVEKIFTNNVFSLGKNDCVYIASDGFADQFNEIGKKLMTKKFKEILLANHELNMDEQGAFLLNFINNWKKNTEQTDDILVIGIKI